MTFFKKKGWKVFLIVIIFAIICASISRMGNNPISRGINLVLTPVQSFFTRLTQPVHEYVDFICNMDSYKKENAELKKNNRVLSAKVKNVEEYIDENARLQRLLGISEKMTDYTTVVARVISYEPDNWYSYVTINKGYMSGIKVSDTVITADGLLGQVTEVGNNWARVSTLINSESSIGVRIARNGEIGIVEGDTKLAGTKMCKLGYLNANASVMTGDVLETSGLGGIYPPGFGVGTIGDVKKDSMGRLDYAVVEPFVDFNNLYEVIVITKWSISFETASDSDKKSVFDTHNAQSDSSDIHNPENDYHDNTQEENDLEQNDEDETQNNEFEAEESEE